MCDLEEYEKALIIALKAIEISSNEFQKGHDLIRRI